MSNIFLQSTFEEWQKMLAQHVLPMRRSLGTDGVVHTATSPVREASVSPAGKQSARNTSPGSRKDAGRTFEPARRGRRLRTESWTISEDKALHAATAVADAILISDHEMASEGVDTNEYVTPEDAKENLDDEEFEEEDKEKSTSSMNYVKEKEYTEQKVIKPEPEMKTQTSSPMVSSESVKPNVAPSGKIVKPLLESEPGKNVESLSESEPRKIAESLLESGKVVERQSESESGKTVEPLSGSESDKIVEPLSESESGKTVEPPSESESGKIVESESESGKIVEPPSESESGKIVESESESGKIVEPQSESESVDGLEKRVYSLRQDPAPLSRSSPKSDTELTAVESEGQSKSVLREPSMTSSTDSESTTSRKLDESARESFDTSCDSLRLVLEDDEDQDDLNESRLGEIDDKDAESEGSKPAGIPLSDSMPELSKICEQPADTTGGANLTVPELTPVKDLAGKPLVPEPGASKRMEFRSQRTRALETDDSSQDDVQDENVDIEGGDVEGDMEVQAVNSQLMAHLAKNAPIDNNVVVLAKWSVHSDEDAGEDDVGELDVTGATGDSAEDGVVQVDADKLRKAMRENNKPSETTEDKTHHADESTDAPKDVSLITFKNKLDNILGQYVAADEIEEDVVSDVREQIDDIVTAVELNESRDEELSRSFEGSPEKEDPDKSTEEDDEQEKDDADEHEKPKKQEDKFEEYLPEGSKENGDDTDKAKNAQKEINNKDSGKGTSDSGKEQESDATEATPKSSKKSEGQPSEASDR